MLKQEYLFKEVIRLTDISSRNIKFYCEFYNLEVKKKGRNNYYPLNTFTALKVIKLLTDSKFFTSRFINLVIKKIIYDDNIEEEEAYYEKVCKELQEIIKNYKDEDIEILPGLKKGVSVKKINNTSLTKNRRKENVEIL